MMQYLKEDSSWCVNSTAGDRIQRPEKGLPPEIASGPPFAFESFHLLADLHAHPTRSFYEQYQDEFEKFVEAPFQRLFQNVVAGLPSALTTLMETEKGIFSSIPKNDFGRGGASSFYWGALYPRNGQRLKDAQLFLWINRERLEFGFHIGEYGSEQRKRFVRNCQKSLEGVMNLLRESLTGDPWRFGIQDEFLGGENDRKHGARSLSWKEWLKSSEEAGIKASVILDNTEVLQSSRERLRDRIRVAFEKLFPLILLAVFEDPLPLIIENLEGERKPPQKNAEYPLTQWSEETNLEENRLQSWVRAIERKGQAILYGPSGTGKTYVAEKFARHLIGGGNGFCEMIQFHPGYTYEDFVGRTHPTASTEASPPHGTVPGRFLDFCNRARERQGRCVLIIDEINRAPLPRVFGELIYLLEYRDCPLPLAGGGEISVPANVRVLGTMNGADRPLAAADHGLHRRFAFLPLTPNYEVLRKYHGENGFRPDGLISVLRSLNEKIGDPHSQVGITYFLRHDLGDEIEDIWKMEIEPSLQKHFCDHQDLSQEFLWDQVKEKIFS